MYCFKKNDTIYIEDMVKGVILKIHLRERSIEIP